MNSFNKVLLGMVIAGAALLGVTYAPSDIQKIVKNLVMAVAVSWVLYAWVFSPQRERTTYTAKEGKHRTGIYCKPIINRSLTEFNFKFFDDSLYGAVEHTQLGDQINKLYGVSRGLHHNNSFRVGYRQRGKQMEILSYCYVNGTPHTQHMLYADLNKTYRGSILIEDDTVYVEVDGVITQIPIEGTLPIWGYRLYPYFGGEAAAPKDIPLELQIIR